MYDKQRNDARIRERNRQDNLIASTLWALIGIVIVLIGFGFYLTQG